MLATTEPSSSRPAMLTLVFCIASWICWSNLTVLSNKWILDPSRFPYPVTLTCWHLTFATLATQVLARATTLLDGRHKVDMTTSLYLTKVAPIGILFSGSLVSSNLVYAHLSVAFIQMLKAGGPVITLLVAWMWRVETPSWRAFLNIVAITFGVAIAALGEIEFSLIGSIYQVAALVFDANRLVMIQILLSEGQKMDPLVSLYYFAPVCAIMNASIAAIAEWPTMDVQAVWVSAMPLVMNATVAFMLSVSIVFLIGKTSSLIMSLVSIPKNILLVAFSVVMWSTPISLMQIIGYSIATLALLIYTVGWNTICASFNGLPTSVQLMRRWWKGLDDADAGDSAEEHLLMEDTRTSEGEEEAATTLFGVVKTRPEGDLEKGTG